MKKPAFLLLFAALAFAFLACGEATTTTSTLLPTEVSTTTTTTTTSTASTTRTLRQDETADIALDFDLSVWQYTSPTFPVALRSVISDHAVLQQGKAIRVFGSGTPGSLALVKLVKDADPWVSYKNAGLVGTDGTFVLELPALSGSFDSYTLTVSDTVNEIRVHDLVIGEVWVSGGQSNMQLEVEEMAGGETEMASADNPMIRLFYQYTGDHNGNFPYTPAPDVVGGIWKTADSGGNIKDFSGIGYAYAKKLYQLLSEEGLGCPVGILGTSLGGTMIQTWLPVDVQRASSVWSAYVRSHQTDLGEAYNFDQNPYNPSDWCNFQRPGALYNAKVAPLFNFQVKGVLWYQGESDAVYEPNLEAIPMLIDSWSRGFNQNDELLDFVMIQIAPYDGGDPMTSTSTHWFSGFADQRRAQLEVAAMAKYAATTVIVPIYDVSLFWDVPLTQFPWANVIHPVTKIPVGERAAKEAYTAFYWGYVDFLPPQVSSVEFDATSVTISFTHAGTGLKAFKNASSGIATVQIIRRNGTKQFVPCTILDADSLQITGLDTTVIAYVTYAWLSRNEEANLGNSLGIPALPFRVPINPA